MANITRFNPFDESLDDLFRGFFVKPVAFEGERAQAMQLKMDVKENGNAYVVHAEIPGVKKEDIHVSVEGNQVSISAEVKRQSEEKEGERVLRSERYHGRLQRMFTLGADIDSSAAQAKYNEGVLELTLPKKAAASNKRLAIQ